MGISVSLGDGRGKGHQGLDGGIGRAGRAGSVSAGNDRPYYSLFGAVDYDLPDAVVLKDVGGRIVVGRFAVFHVNNETAAFGQWGVSCRTAIGTTNPSDHWELVDQFARFRDALKDAKRRWTAFLADGETVARAERARGAA